MIATVIKLQQKGIGELEVKSSAPVARGGDILSESFQLPLWELKTGVSIKTVVSQVDRLAKSVRKHISIKCKGDKEGYQIREGSPISQPRPIVRLIGDTSGTNIIVDGVSCKGLVD